MTSDTPIRVTPFEGIDLGTLTQPLGTLTQPPVPHLASARERIDSIRKGECASLIEPPVHVEVRGEALHPIWWRGRQWAVTAYGVEALDGTIGHVVH